MLIKSLDAFRRNFGEVRYHEVGGISVTAGICSRYRILQAEFSQDVGSVGFQRFVMADEVVMSLARLTKLVERSPVTVWGLL